MGYGAMIKKASKVREIENDESRWRRWYFCVDVLIDMVKTATAANLLQFEL